MADTHNVSTGECPPSAGLALLANAATAKTCWPDGNFAFAPNEVKAVVGEVLRFHFPAGNRSVVEGDFKCDS